MSPYEILGLPSHTNDKDVRKAYLELVRKYPPETHPDKFQKINSAYEVLKDEKSRMRFYVFNRETGIDSPFEALFIRLSDKEKRIPLSFTEMKEYIRKCST